MLETLFGFFMLYCAVKGLGMFARGGKAVFDRNPELGGQAKGLLMRWLRGR